MSNHIIMLLEMLSDLADIDDVLFITKSNGATSEVRSNSLETVRQNQRWITIGNNDGPAHMHIDSELVCSARFVQEAKPDRTSYSVRFFDQKGDRVFAAFFTKMYDDSRRLIPQRVDVYEGLQKRYAAISTGSNDNGNNDGDADGNDILKF